MDDPNALFTCVAQSSVVLLLLGPNINEGRINRTKYADFYKLSVIPQTRQHSVRRILAIGTISIK